MKNIFIFLLGASAGSLGTYFLIKKHYENIANEEINSVIDTFKKKEEKIQNEYEEKNNYKEELNNLGYSVGVDLSKNEKDNYVEEKKVVPYVISEDEFGEMNNEEQTLYYYADDVLADEYDNIIDNPTEVIGDALIQLGDYDDTIYVRNEEKSIDYVILRSDKLYKDIVAEVDD